MIPRVYEHAMKTGLEITGPPVFICHEMTMEEVENAMKNSCTDLEIALPVTGDIRQTGEIKRYEIPGGKMAKIMHAPSE